MSMVNSMPTSDTVQDVTSSFEAGQNVTFYKPTSYKVGNIAFVTTRMDISTNIQYNTLNPIATGLPSTMTTEDNAIIITAKSTANNSTFVAFTIRNRTQLFPHSTNNIPAGTYLMNAIYVCA